MKTYKLTIQPKSPFITPLQSDTLFGHLAWMVCYEQGEKKLADILAAFTSTEPPLVLSQAFPEDMLPVPTLPPLTQEQTRRLAIARYGDDSVYNLCKLTESLKRAKEIKHIPWQALTQLLDNLNPVSLANSLLALAQDTESYASHRTVMRVAINRLTGTALEGALFDHKQMFYRPGTKLTIWLRFRDTSWVDEVHHWFQLLALDGYGKRKSAGLGHFEVLGMEEDELPAAANPNAFITLSSYVPEPHDPTSGYYQYIVKRGKLGGNFALRGDVWKAPLLMFSPGSVFFTEGEVRFCYGRLIPKVHHARPEVVHYGFAFPIPVRIGEVEEKMS